jgi:hypothetical protein
MKRFSYLPHASRGSPMSNQQLKRDALLPRIDTEVKLLRVFERVRSEMAKMETIEEAIQLRSQAEALRVYALQVKCSKEALEQIAETKVRAERRLGQLIVERPETRGGDRKSEGFKNQKLSDSTFDSYVRTLKNLGVSKFLSSRSQLIANIPEELFETRIEYTRRLNRGRDLSAEMFSYAKFLQRETEIQKRREESAARAAQAEPDNKIRILQGDFREVLLSVPCKSVDLIVTDPSYIRKDGTYLDLWYSLSEIAAYLLKPGTGLLLCYSGKFCLDKAIEALGSSLQYLWTAAVLYESFPDTIHALRFKTYFKPVLIYTSKDAEYQPHQTQYWFRDIIQGDGYRGLKEHHPWEQGVSEATYLIENLSYENDLIVDPFVGSGTVAVAAKRLNRRFIGCDEDQSAVEMTLARLAQELTGGYVRNA